MTRYIVGFLLAVGLIIIAIILIVRALSGGPSGPKPLDLTSYANSDVTVQLTIDGPVSAATTHNGVIITVGNNEATLLVTQGYEGQIVRMKSYSTTANGYAVFLRALAFNGFTKGDANPALRDERGQCALGARFIYEVLDAQGNSLQRYWHSTCGTGTFKGNSTVVRTLFTKQIPDYSSLTSGVAL